MSARRVSLEQTASAMESTGSSPRVVVAANFATPWPVVAALDRALEQWTLHMLNAQAGGVPARPGHTAGRP